MLPRRLPGVNHNIMLCNDYTGHGYRKWSNKIPLPPNTIKNLKIEEELYYFYILSYTRWLVYFSALDIESTLSYQEHSQITPNNIHRSYGSPQ